MNRRKEKIKGFDRKREEKGNKEIIQKRIYLRSL
jgi:hypothetical protein